MTSTDISSNTNQGVGFFFESMGVSHEMKLKLQIQLDKGTLDHTFTQETLMHIEKCHV